MTTPRLPQRIGRYEVVDRLGEGGMGVLYLAKDPLLHRTVAIKVLSVQNEELRERFAREARSAAALKHHNIVTIYDVGDDQGRPFLAMEYLDGETLAEMIRRKAAVAVPRRLEWMGELCAGLGYAHRSGIIHRDIKPANVMVTSEGVLKILDFGLARLANDATSAGLTRVGMMIGTVHYMSPEQIEGASIDHRSDIFAVGLVLYEILAYKKAFSGESPHVVLNRIVNSEPQPLRELYPEIHPELEAVVTRAIEKDPARRYQTLAAMAADLNRVREWLSTSEDATINLTAVPVAAPAPAKGPPSGTSKPPTSQSSIPNLEGIVRRRTAQIELHLDAALKHIEAGDHEAAIEQCELAAVLDPHDARVGQMFQRAHRAAEDRQVKEWLGVASSNLSQGLLTQADRLIEQSLQLRPEAGEALELRRRLQELRREQERAAERARSVRAAVDRARTNLENGALESAVRCATEALAYDPENEEAAALRDQARAAIAERRRQEQLDYDASEAAAQARRQAAAGDLPGALDYLRATAPVTHPVVKQAIEELEVAAAAERQREAEEQLRQKQAAEEEARRQAAEQAAREQEEARRREADRVAREQEEARRQAAEQAAREQEETRRREAERVAREQEEARRRAAEQAAREQEDARRRAAEQAAREQEDARRQAAEHAAREHEDARRRAAERAAREQAAPEQAGAPPREDIEDDALKTVVDHGRRPAAVVERAAPAAAPAATAPHPDVPVVPPVARSPVKPAAARPGLPLSRQAVIALSSAAVLLIVIVTLAVWRPWRDAAGAEGEPQPGAAQVDHAAALNTAEQQLGQGLMKEALAGVTVVLAATPGDARAVALLGRIRDNVAAAAEEARKKAEAAQATPEPAFQQGLEKLKEVEGLKDPSQAAAAVDGYLAATELFTRAATAEWTPARFVAEGTQQYEARNVDQALTYGLEALKRDAQFQPAIELLERIRLDARRRADQARARAVAANAYSTVLEAHTLFQRGENKLVEAQRGAIDRASQQVTAYGEAAGLFDRAARDAVRETAARHEQATKHVANARAALGKGQLDQAHTEIKEARGLNPADQEAIDVEREIGRAFEAAARDRDIIQTIEKSRKLSDKEAVDLLRGALARGLDRADLQQELRRREESLKKAAAVRAAPSVPIAAADRAGIARAFDRYKDAHDSRDAGDLIRVAPHYGADEDALRQRFRAIRRYRMEDIRCEPYVSDGTTITAVCTVNSEITRQGQDKPQQVSRKVRFLLQKQRNDWLIVAERPAN